MQASHFNNLRIVEALQMAEYVREEFPERMVNPEIKKNTSIDKLAVLFTNLDKEFGYSKVDASGLNAAKGKTLMSCAFAISWLALAEASSLSTSCNNYAQIAREHLSRHDHCKRVFKAHFEKSGGNEAYLADIGISLGMYREYSERFEKVCASLPQS